MSIIKTILTLKAKLVVLFLLLALIPLTGIGAFFIHTTETLIGNMVLRQLENVAADKAAILERWLEERKEDLQVIAGSSILKSMDPETILPYLLLVQRQYGVYKNISVLSTAGETIVSTNGLNPAGQFGEWGRDVAEKALLLSDITFLPEETESSFHIAAPIFNPDSKTGTVYATVGTHKIISSILQVSLGETGECYLVDKNGTFLAHKEPRRILAENISQSGSFKNIFGNRDRTDTYLDYRNIEVLGTSRNVEGTDWHIVVEQDRDEAYQSVKTLKYSIFFTIVLAISSALVLVWIISRHVVRPIRDLSRTAGALAAGESDVTTAPTTRQDEIGVLCRAFAEMAEKIHERQKHLKHEVDLKEAELKENDHTLAQMKLIAERSERFAALGRLGAAVAHEIRTPLTSLKLFMESVQSDIEISPEFSEDFAIAMDQVARIETAINRFLDFTKPKDLTFTAISISRLIADVAGMVRPLAKKQECDMKIDVDSSLPEIIADKKLLEEAMLNLLVNSLEAIPEKGHLFLTAVPDRLESAERSSPCVRIDIKDSGTGIPTEYMDLIFDPFFTTKASGTGLGLPMVLNTIKRHDGEIRVTSLPSEGTVFSIYLPTDSLRT